MGLCYRHEQPEAPDRRRDRTGDVRDGQAQERREGGRLPREREARRPAEEGRGEVTALADRVDTATPTYQSITLRPGERAVELRCTEGKHFKAYILHLENVDGLWHVRAYWWRMASKRKVQGCVKYVGMTRGSAAGRFAKIVAQKKRPHRADRNRYVEFCASEGGALLPRRDDALGLADERGGHHGLRAELLDRFRMPVRRLHADARLG